MSTTAVSGPSWGLGAGDLWSRRPDRLKTCAVIVAISFVSYIVARLLEGGVSTAFQAVGVGACGWAWLLARALFDPLPRDAWWPRIVVLIVATSGASAVLAPDGLAARVVGNLYTLSGSTTLLLTFVEPFHHYRRGLASAEKRFRLAFLALYAVLVGASVLGLWASAGADPRWDNLVKCACAVAGLGGAMAAVGFRLRRPLETMSTPRRAPTVEDRRLAERLEPVLQQGRIDSEPDLRIGDVAARLGEPEYRVSQCISGALGFANFNRLINHYRVERARQRLADPAETGSILQIAFDCGFGSIGPFNRAFKDQVGSTPRAFRRAAARNPPMPEGGRSAGSALLQGETSS